MLVNEVEAFVSARIPRDLDVSGFKPSLHKRNPVYQPWLYPLFGIHRLCSDFSVAKPIVYSTTIALLQSGIITGGYVYVSFKYVHWFVTRHLLNFSYFNLRPLFRAIQTVSGQSLTAEQCEWYTAGLMTLFQAAILSNSLIGYKIRAQGKRAGDAVLATKSRRKQVPVVVRENQELGYAGNFLWRFIKNSLWNTFILPIYAVPVAGQLIYAFIRAPSITSNYLSMFNSYDLAKSHRYGVIGFGIIAGLLSALPFIGHLFHITNSVGIALWIQDLENQDEEETTDKQT